MNLLDIKGIGEKKLIHLNKLGIYTINDLLEFYPYSYIDTTKFKKISDINDDGIFSFRLKIVNLVENRRKKSIHITKFLAMDEEQNYCYLVYFNNKFITRSIKIGSIYELYGKTKLINDSIEIQNPIIQSNLNLIGKIVPQYHLTNGITNNELIKYIKYALNNYDGIEETLPEYILKEINMLDYKKSLEYIHFPENIDLLNKAKRRLSFDEIFYFQLILNYYKTDNNNFVKFNIDKEVNDFIRTLPFELTNSQNKVLNEIFTDMHSEKQMNRLIQGDVGSGKTIISMIALFNAFKNGYQGALMVPTEILARQHFENALKLFEKFNINIELLVGSLKESEKKEIRKRILSGESNIIIGTHALFQEKVEYNKLGLVITDEQHRFGVKQRLKLSQKAINPDIIVMSATPIPRTMALVTYCDLDISTIDQLPSGRGVIKTYFVNESYEERFTSFIQKYISEGRQAYIVCPLIDESDTLELQSVLNLYDKLKNKYFSNIKIEFIHGKLKQNEKDEIMYNFQNNITKVLVSTTVIEVGINVPNANIMVIYNAERFGLSQLHQLRGRIGRGKYDSYCILVSNKRGETLKKRMEIMCKSNDGFYIAEQDFLLRGYGEILGKRQSGDIKFKMIDIQKDYDIFKLSKKYVDFIISDDSELNNKKNYAVYKRLKYLKKNIDDNIILN